MADGTANGMNGDDVPAPDEDLVAYLDGELDAAASQHVESKLAVDAAARTKAESLRKTYDLLEYLPKPEPSSTFASRTLTKIDAVPAAVKPSVNGSASVPVTVPAAAPTTGTAFNFNSNSTASAMAMQAPSSKGWSLALWCLAAGLAAVFGYFGHLLAKPHLNSRGTVQTSQQVRLLEHLPLYTGVDDLPFLKKLEELDLFPEFDYETESPKPSVTSIAGESVSSTELAKLEDTFSRLPAARQQQLRQLDEDFHALDPATHSRLHSILERYAVWLEQLPEDYRKEILSAPAVDERIEAVRRVKNRLWRKHLPAAVRARLDETADQEERDRILGEVKKQDALRREEWIKAREKWSKRNSTEKPYPFDNAELTRQVEDYVSAVLKPRLQNWELNKLDELRKDTAQGGYIAWYLYGAAILFAAESHPNLPEPRNGKPITKVEELPPDVARKLRPVNILRPGLEKRELKNLPQHGKWPDFADAVASEANSRNIPIPPLGPCRPGEFKPEVDEAIVVLLNQITPREKLELESKLGKWPEYPKLLIGIARRNDVSLPGVTLPGSPKEWLTAYPPRDKR